MPQSPSGTSHDKCGDSPKDQVAIATSEYSAVRFHLQDNLSLVSDRNIKKQLTFRLVQVVQDVVHNF